MVGKMQPVAFTSEAQLAAMKENPGGNHLMWGEPLPHHNDIPLYAEREISSEGWQDFKSAPTDKAIWLAHVSGLMEPAVAVKTTSGMSIAFWKNIYTDLPVQWRPTHWHHLPDFPTTKL